PSSPPAAPKPPADRSTHAPKRMENAWHTKRVVRFPRIGLRGIARATVRHSSPVVRAAQGRSCRTDRLGRFPISIYFALRDELRNL
ncbi:MAG: hypothetical protein ACKOCK_03670, partial [Chloroflexota bacterium]